MPLPDAKAYESHTVMHTSTANTDISLEREFQKHLSDPTRAQGLLDHSKYIKHASKQKVLIMSIMSKKTRICHTFQLKCHVQKLSSQNFHFVVRIQNLMELDY